MIYSVCISQADVCIKQKRDIALTIFLLYLMRF